MRGVRGYGDPHPARAAIGAPVWRAAERDAEVLPFRPDARGPRRQLPRGPRPRAGTASTRRGTRAGTTAGSRPRATTTMAHLRRGDMPFHYALADAFTVCDAYHCSHARARPNPNRYYLWTGWVGNDGKGGGPEVSNSRARPTTGRRSRSGCSRPASPGRSTRTPAPGSTPRTTGAGGSEPVHRQLRRQLAALLHQYQKAHPGRARCTTARATGTEVKTAGTLFDQLTADVSETLPARSCRRSRGSSRPRRTPSTRTGRRTTAPGTSRRCSTR